MPRLFVALRPPPAIREVLFDTMDGVPAARWQDDEQLHLTLRFIGDVDRPVAEDVAAALAAIHTAAPVVALGGVGRFARRGRTEALWAAVTPHDALAHLHRKVDQACVRAGLDPERRAYLPHITLARLPRSLGEERPVEAWLARAASLASAPFALPHLILYHSALGRGGAVYEPIARWPLGTS
ncbi:RNA 2',3'-cyclic phosphodiesterase [Sphingomonas oligophenolica]|uniref:RNA 2',3'-cyclic phosphodiesterase n=1 Tax=Sphingomonas oligophenolica TaxID=301154 RepID=A0A502CS52_9SPHN|nr:RNA 2',3'-cyclic phosphodiesterase [Sphingomonas oligophenolica]TPG15708.1 RNA 2',3'-cyclic phosphodiesterase [Sphingomonas oligophenolica]